MLNLKDTSRLLLAFSLTLAFAGVRVQADSITFSGGTGWTNASTFSNYSVSNPSASPYTSTNGTLPSGDPFFWNGNSSDGPAKGVGYLLTATGAYAGKTQYIPAQNLYYYSSTGGAAPSVETFTSTSSVATTYIASIAANAGSNVLGIINETDSAQGVQYITGTGLDEDGNGTGPTTLITLLPGDTYAFFLSNNGYEFVSDTTNSANTDHGNQHFAIFSNNANGNGPFYVGVEDLPYASSDLDFNDFVFEMQAQPVPEPASMILCSLGALGMVGYCWRKKVKGTPA
jgi:Domain of unknown function (DUF4114)/PEP-CTERM motif